MSTSRGRTQSGSISNNGPRAWKSDKARRDPNQIQRRTLRAFKWARSGSHLLSVCDYGNLREEAVQNDGPALSRHSIATLILLEYKRLLHGDLQETRESRRRLQIGLSRRAANRAICFQSGSRCLELSRIGATLSPFPSAKSNRINRLEYQSADQVMDKHRFSQ